jgi:hypothetical protein
MICAVCIARCGVDFGGNDPGTFRRHGTRGGTTNSGPRTGDQSDHSIKACHVSPPRPYRRRGPLGLNTSHFLTITVYGLSMLNISFTTVKLSVPVKPGFGL